MEDLDDHPQTGAHAESRQRLVEAAGQEDMTMKAAWGEERALFLSAVQDTDGQSPKKERGSSRQPRPVPAQVHQQAGAMLGVRGLAAGTRSL